LSRLLVETAASELAWRSGIGYTHSAQVARQALFGSRMKPPRRASWWVG